MADVRFMRGYGTQVISLDQMRSHMEMLGKIVAPPEALVVPDAVVAAAPAAAAAPDDDDDEPPFPEGFANALAGAGSAMPQSVWDRQVEAWKALATSISPDAARKMDPLMELHKHRALYPLVADALSDIIGLSASTAAVEGLFLTAQPTVSSRRSTLGSDMAEGLILANVGGRRGATSAAAHYGVRSDVARQP